MKKIFSLILVSFLMATQAHAQLSMKTHELDYKNNSTSYMYAGIKSTVRLMGLPYNADYIQVVVVNNPDVPKARIIGDRKIEVLKGNSNIAQFILEMEEVEKTTPYNSSIELKIKAFSKINDQYEIVDKISMFVRPIVCNGQDEVCALIKTKCHSNNPECLEREIARTLKSDCDADKIGAKVLYKGACSE